MTLRKRYQRRDGFILVTVVFLIAFCSLILVGTSRRTLQVRFQAIELEENLQQKWGTATLERHLIDIAPTQLRPQANQTRNRMSYQIELGKFQFISLLSDEQAKMNLSTVLYNRSRTFLENKLTRDMELDLVKLHPNDDDPANLGSTSFNAWGQVFDLNSIPRNDKASFLADRTTYITLWGSGGQLHYKNANDDVIVTLLRLAVSSNKSRRFLRILNENREEALDTILRNADFTDKEQVNVHKILTEESSCFSVMTQAKRNKHSNWRYVVAEKVGSQTRTWTFTW